MNKDTLKDTLTTFSVLYAKATAEEEKELMRLHISQVIYPSVVSQDFLKLNITTEDLLSIGIPPTDSHGELFAAGSVKLSEGPYSRKRKPSLRHFKGISGTRH